MGHEHGGVKPCVVILDNPFQHVLTVVPLTTSVIDDYSVRIEQHEGVDAVSYAMIGHVRSISPLRIQDRLDGASVSAPALKRILEEFHDTFCP